MSFRRVWKEFDACDGFLDIRLVVLKEALRSRLGS